MMKIVTQDIEVDIDYPKESFNFDKDLPFFNWKKKGLKS